MLHLSDNESTFVQGSASKPYEIKNVAGVYSCTCPAWRNQSLPIDKRTCKHLRSLRGEETEQARIGSALPARKFGNATNKPANTMPSLLLAESWDGAIDPTGWLLSEKLDGVRAYWDGKMFLSRNGNRFFAPDWFTRGLPLEPLDGELWIGRRQFQRTVSIVRRQEGGDLWREVRFAVFDAPANDDPFEKRLALLDLIMEIHRPEFAMPHPHLVCKGQTHLQQELARITTLGGEGVMLRQPGSPYVFGRSATLLKVKRFHDAEARVIAHEPGAGRHKGRLGALRVEMADGTQFAVGTGFSDAERAHPPRIGSIITYRYQELSTNGVPRFPSFVRTREDAAPLIQQGERAMAVLTKRRFECVEGSSSKFWQVVVDGPQVKVTFGRIGTVGQTDVKSFDDAAAAAKHAEKKVAEKLRKGYVAAS